VVLLPIGSAFTWLACLQAAMSSLSGLLPDCSCTSYWWCHDGDRTGISVQEAIVSTHRGGCIQHDLRTQVIAVELLCARRMKRMVLDLEMTTATRTISIGTRVISRRAFRLRGAHRWASQRRTYETVVPLSFVECRAVLCA
jgi:hypothetical protein